MKVVARGELLAMVELDGLYSFPEGGFEDNMSGHDACLGLWRRTHVGIQRGEHIFKYFGGSQFFLVYALRVE
jgi:hypothetical protein